MAFYFLFFSGDGHWHGGDRITWNIIPNTPFLVYMGWSDNGTTTYSNPGTGATYYARGWLGDISPDEDAAETFRIMSGTGIPDPTAMGLAASILSASGIEIPTAQVTPNRVEWYYWVVGEIGK